MALLKRLHKWIGLLIGLQVLVWVLSGLVISVLDPEKVSGDALRAARDSTPSLETGTLLEPEDLSADLVTDALGVSLTNYDGRVVYRVQKADGALLVDAGSGSVIEIDRSDAEGLARKDYTGEGEITSVQRGRAPDLETRNSTGEYWRVEFSDSVATTLFISASTGEILERRNSYWRVRDFFWMLHIMDYPGRENFNNALVIGVALVAVWLGMTGFILLFGSFSRHDFSFLDLSGKREMVTVGLIDPSGAKLRQLEIRRGSNLFLSLAMHGVNLPSICGGGGECGKCRIQMEGENLPATNTTEQGLVPASLRERGFRLACQQTLNGDITIRLREEISSNGG